MINVVYLVIVFLSVILHMLLLSSSISWGEHLNCCSKFNMVSKQS
jgi:hypothetical protein